MIFSMFTFPLNEWKYDFIDGKYCGYIEKPSAYVSKTLWH